MPPVSKSAQYIFSKNDAAAILEREGMALKAEGKTHISQRLHFQQFLQGAVAVDHAQGAPLPSG